MANRTNASTAYDSYEYYLDYLDLIPVDEKKLKASKHSIVIAFWVSLAAFVVFLFLLLLSMSWPASPQTRKVRTGGGMWNSAQHHPTCPWSLGLNLPFCVWKQPQHHGAPQGTPLPLPSSVEEPGGRASGPVQQLQQESPSTSAPFHPPEPPCSPLGTGPRWGPARYQLTSGTSSPVSLPCRQNLSTVEPTTQTRAIAE
ncbi:melanocortin-2 receptor accessory protein isoform X1 [Neophocaena asiaeorientalis asiaeorientalis]|uniref:Melanocortin-2 receptor accessory protein isoform X1 n=1 Tax=Neophocaena asiaeorientalis asiaeorientalis TaxID=1706337 RepID=A0A341CHQ8_NEOAA|nr:melanocortin-2 receptor accessory protein isoform X1 [Neophocaena asiaeorientalis asiaeorientalis]